MRRSLLITVAVLASVLANAQDFSNKGKDFWVSYPEHIDANNSIMGLYLTSNVNTTGTINDNGTIINFTVTANNITTVFLGTGGAGPNTYIHLANLQDGIKTGAAVHITSALPIVVYAHIIRTARSGATLALPTNVWGKEYIVPSYASSAPVANGQGYGEINVMASLPNTVVEITPSITTRNGARPAGVPYTVTLANPGDVYQVQFPQNADLSGTKIKSIASGTSGCQPIAVITASTWSAINCGSANGGDNFYQQLFPYGAWGKTFITTPLKKVITTASDNNTDIIRVYVKDPATVVTKMDNGTTVTLTGLNAVGNFYEYTAFRPTVITADQPVQVMQYVTTQGCGSPQTQSDPEMVTLSAVEQTLNDITVYSAIASAVPGSNSQINTHYINVTMKTADIGSFRINGAIPSSPFNAIAGTNYSFLKQNIPTSTPVSRLTADSGFSAIAYGFGQVESYGYNAGTNVRDLTQQLQIASQYGIESSPNVCTGSPFQFKVYFPESTSSSGGLGGGGTPVPLRFDSMKWNITPTTGITPNNFPVMVYGTVGTPPTVAIDSITTVNGRQVAWYSLPTFYTISTPGIYTMTVTCYRTTTEGCGNAQDFEFTLEVSSPPASHFYITNNGCVTDSVRFFDNTVTSKPTYLWYWNFGEPSSGVNNTSNLKNPVHKYATAGSYLVKYYNITTAGCIGAEFDTTITVTDVPSAKFGMSSPICAGVPVTFSDTSIAYAPGVLTKWKWDFGDGFKITRNNGSDTTHIYNPWNPNVSDTLWVLTQTGCTSPPFVRNFKVNPNPVPNFNLPAGVCLPWDSAHFIDATTIPDNTTPFTYAWDFGDPGSGANNASALQNPVHYYASPGSYNIKLTATSAAGCVHDTTKTLVNIYPQAHADFTVQPENCLNTATIFTDNSTGNGNAIAQYFWDFGDGSPISNVVSPSHTYLTAGTKTIKHWVRTNVTCYSDTMTKTVIINQLPTANFSSTGPFCAAGTISFTDLSVANSGNVVGWGWAFGDAATGNAQNPTHTYAVANTYNVTLVVNTDKGCTSPMVTIPVTIHPLPVAAFTHTPVCLPFGITNFTNGSSVGDGTALSFAWDFGDPPSGGLNTSTATNPSHYYSGTGPFTTQLTVTSAPGCIGTASQQITDVYAQPHANFTVNPENCLNDVTSFTSNATGSGNTITEYHWDFGDASGSTSQNPTHTYATPGTKTVKHWVVNDKGCYSDTTTQTVVINPLPTGNFNFITPSCETRVISFTDASVANVGTLSTWTWDFDDPTSGAANTSSLQNPTHTFATARTYNVKLTVTNSKNCTSTIFTKAVTINARPKAGFIIPEVCLSDTYAQFNDTSKVAGGTITNWNWNFGDPGSGAANTSTLQNPQHSYTAVGNYNVQLIVTSNNGCKDTIVQVLTINGSFPVANFTVNNPTTLCANDSVSIVNTSTVFPGNITKVEIYWDNINAPGASGTEYLLDDFPFANKVYKHKYANFQSPLTKTFQVRFRAYSGGVCVNDKISTITVNAAPKVQFNNIPNICLDAAPYQITQATETGGVPGNGVYSGPGVTPGGLFTPSVTGPGTFTIKYTYTSTAAGCVDTLSKTITVYQPPIADFSFSSLNCEKSPITFTDNSSTPVGTLTTWTWDFGDGTAPVVRNSAAAFTHTFATTGTYNVHLRVTTSNGCVSVDKILPVTVKPQPRPSFSFPASVCIPNANVLFTNASSIADATALTYTWDFGDPGSGTANTSSGVNPAHFYTAVGPFAVKLQATSVAGCVHDTTISLNIIHPQPKADFVFSKPSVCIGAPVTVTDRSDGKDGTINQWFWDMGDASLRNTSSVTYQYANAQTYNVTLYTVNSNGCNSDTITKAFTVYPYPVVDAGPDRVVLEGGSITLQPNATGNSLQYLWTPSTYLSNDKILNPVASNLLTDMTYTFTVTAQGGCAASDQVFVKLLKFPVIPNTFTPNNDGINDFWTIDYLDTYPGNRVQVFNRYGQLVFESYGYSKPWDGTYKGKALPVGTYYYIIEPKNGRAPMTGYVTIIK